ncbi:radical SAM/SPASM domain-containing protein [Pseudodesulfovibrio sp.]|uniref:radical SAM protein n=1 Tax=unclassified Pseudodesulfovibrio TaxID=2661612 RepID=UPI003B00B410
MSIYLNAKKMNQVFLDDAFQFNKEYTVSYPNKLTVLITERCNYRCTMCNGSIDRGLTMQQIQQLEPLLPFASESTLLGGEPLLHPNISEILNLWGKYDIRTAFITNASMLTPDIARCIVENGVERVTVSIDAASPKTYSNIRIGGNFFKVLKNIATLTKEKIKARATQPRITFNYVAMRQNIDELVKLVEIASEIGVEEISAFNVLVHSKECMNQSLFFDQERANQGYLAAKEAGERYGVNVIIPPLFGQESDTAKACVKCKEPWNTMLIDSEGSVRACCRMEAVGNIYQDPFDEIWNGEILRKYRRTVNTPEELDTCKFCHMGMKTPDVNSLNTHFAKGFRTEARELLDKECAEKTACLL